MPVKTLTEFFSLSSERVILDHCFVIVVVTIIIAFLACSAEQLVTPSTAQQYDYRVNDGLLCVSYICRFCEL